MSEHTAENDAPEHRPDCNALLPRVVYIGGHPNGMHRFCTCGALPFPPGRTSA